MSKRSYVSPYLSESKKKKRRARLKKIIFYILIFAAVFAGLSYLSKWEKLNIKTVEVSGNRAVDSLLVERAVQEQISGYYLWFFPKSNFFIYPKAKIKSDLEDKFKTFQDISLNLQGAQKIQIKVSERVGRYTWCGAELPAEASTQYKCYFMDAEGYIFGEAPYFSGDVYLRFFGKGSEGEKFYPDIFSKLLSFRKSIEEIGLKAPSLLVKDDGDIELYLSSSVSFDAALTSAPKIIFKTNSDFDKLIENLQAALDTDPLKSDFKNKRSSLEYIDLRFGNKVYYRFK
jgi:hypothetical protein